MRLYSSIKSLFQVLREDWALYKLGAPRGWLFYLHYKGRWADRTSRTIEPESVSFVQHGRQVHLQLSALYLGAFKGVFLDQEYRCEDILLTPPLRIVDVGANIGMGAVYLNALFSGAEFICVEPDPRNLSLLSLNLQTNQVLARVENVAVASQSGIMQLRFGADPTCSALETSPMHQLENSVSVTVKTMDEVLDAAGWDSVDLLKIDIEGIEDELLSKNNGWLNRISALILEIHPNTTSERIASYLHPFGFQLKRVGYGAEPVYFAARSGVKA